jgi:hypothetical protein
MNRMRFEPGDTFDRFDSDREALPFPMGGVFGPIRPSDRPQPSGVWRTDDVINAIETTIDSMQAKLDELEDDVEAVIGTIGTSDDDWNPRAA